MKDAVSGDWSLRDVVRGSDASAVERLVRSSGYFRDDEVAVAVELVEEALAKGEASGYRFLFAERAPTVGGYACYGEIPCTLGSYDLYWIAVDDALRGHGLGRLLLREVEARILGLGGRRVYIETSASELYGPTQHFYEAAGYRQEAVLEDFYKPGDAKIVYGKALGRFRGDP